MPTKTHVMTEKFETQDVVALYLKKTFEHGQMARIKAIVRKLGFDDKKFAYEDEATHNKIRQILAKKFKWLPSLRYNHSGLHGWMFNIYKNHGETLEI